MINNPEVPIDYDGYRDSEEQFLVAKRVKENGIKFNEALFIKDERIEELSSCQGYDKELTPSY